MSIYNDASLIYYPSGYKAGTAYSLKPTDGSGDLTFTRASTATRVNAEGLIEGVRTNLLLQSNQFDTTWTNIGYTLTSGQAGYDGTNNAWLVECTSAGQALYQVSSASGVSTFSVYLKQGTANFLRLRADQVSDALVVFDLSDGSLHFQNSQVINANVVDLGSDWYRCSMTWNIDTLSNVQVRAEDGNGSPILGTFYIQDAQLEASVQATDYIPTTTTAVSVGMLANVPRIDYTGGGCGKLLLEPQRTNSVLRSDEFDNAAWAKNGVTISANATTSPDGDVNADKYQGDGTNSPKMLYTYGGGSVTSGTKYTWSAFVKRGTLNFCQLIIGSATFNAALFSNFDLLNGTIGLSGGGAIPFIESYGNDWYRVGITATANANGTATPFIILANSATMGRISSFTTSDYIYIYGAHYEEGSYPTSYIPTTSTAVTRLADTASKTGISSLINDSEGVLYAEISALADDLTYRILSISDGTTAERIYMQYTNATNTVAVVIKNGSTTQANMNYALSDETELAKVAIKYKANDFALWVNGFEVGTDASGTTPTGLSELAFDDGGGGNYFYGNVQTLMVFPTALSDDDLTLLTGTLGETYFESYALMANYLNYTIQ